MSEALNSETVVGQVSGPPINDIQEQNMKIGLLY